MEHPSPTNQSLKRKRDDDDDSVGELEELEKAELLLKEALGDSAELKPEQREVLSLLLQPTTALPPNVLYVVKTGGGKSAAYLLATQLLRKRNPKAGPTLVICPLNALAADQVTQARIRFGMEAFAFNGRTASGDRAAILQQLKPNKIDILYVTPEMLIKGNLPKEVIQFNVNFKPQYQPQPWDHFPLIVIDEAHCVSEWGHGYRPDYLYGMQKLAEMNWFRNAPKLATSATINDRARRDLEFIGEWTTCRGPLFRENLAIRVVTATNLKAKEKWLVESAKGPWASKNILIFCTFKESAEYWCKILTQNGIQARYHHSGVRDQGDIETQFRDGQLRCVVATDTLGMGFDKPDIHVVVHLESPASPIKYYQQIGRAGRDEGIQAEAYLVPTRPVNYDNTLRQAWGLIYAQLRAGGQFRNRVELVDYLYSKNIKKNLGEEAVNTAIDRGTLLMQNGVIALHPSAQADDPGDAEFVDKRIRELDWMVNFPKSKCLWRALLGELQETTEALCGMCSSCCPVGEHELAPDSSAAFDVCYQAHTPGGIPVYALGVKEDKVNLDASRIRAILAQYVRGFQIDPPKWLLSYVPSSKYPNKENFEWLTDKLQTARAFEYIRVRPGAGNARDQKTFESRKEVTKNKFIFDDIPKDCLGGVILYDNSMSTGLTMDAAAAPLVAAGIPVVGLVQIVWPWKGQDWKELPLTPYDVDKSSEDVEEDAAIP